MKVALVLAVLVGAALAVPPRTQRIVGGEPTTIEQYNFMASMIYVFGVWEYQSCGGALLTSTTVLSAAHCYFGDSARQWRVRLGSTYKQTGGTVFNVAQLINHEQYNSVTVNNDVAIVVLDSPATFGGNIGTAQISGANYILPDNTPVYAIGWGSLWASGPSPNDLQHVQVLTINWDVCAERYEHLRSLPGFHHWPELTRGMSCSGILDVGGKSACQGDSGGPLVHNGNVVYGVTSWGYGCAEATYPGVNAFVPHYADWIVANGSV